jgi:dTDP-4-amino-4,6-dideoxygalactose transaminase
MIPFNRPSAVGKELAYIAKAVADGKTAGNGPFTQKCQRFFEERYGFTKCLLTTSCTDALEMAALLADIQPGDEVIVPSYTFVSTALAFVRQGARIVFADSRPDHPNMDAEALEPLVTERTRAIVPVHYGGYACDMLKILALAQKHGLLVIADAAQAVDAYYTGDLSSVRHPWHRRLERVRGAYPLGGLGHLGCFSFHETKNVQCGEGGMLAINDPRFIRRAEIIWEKGTNRAEFCRGEVSRYEWVDVGSSFLPSGITAAFLYAQLENLWRIQNKRKLLWRTYYAGLKPLARRGCFDVPRIPPYSTNNAHMFYLVCRSQRERARLIDHLKANGIQTATHYLSLRDSSYYRDKAHGPEPVNCGRFVDCLVRLPLFYALEREQVLTVVEKVRAFYER